MTATKPSDLSRQAKTLLTRSLYDPKKLVLLHAAVSLGITLLMTALSYFFSLKIADTGGLAGMGTRSILTTIQSVLEFLVMVLLPFWEIGILFSALRWASGEDATPPDLLRGFHRFRAVLGAKLLQGVVLIAISIAVVYTCTFFYLMTPYGTRLMELMDPLLMGSDPEILMDEAWVNTIMEEMAPLMTVSWVIVAFLAIPVFYRLRFADYAVLEGTPAFRSLIQSVQMTKGNWRHLLKIDLYFWWFYLLQILTVAISYRDTILEWLGIPLPLSRDGSFFLFYIVGIVCQCVLLWQCQSKVLTTYGLLYRGICPQNPPIDPETQSKLSD
ncbi:MAG: hypothetical protein IKK11_04865 [Oscillospiraceae bacterium]|nr:hypothetical protein [Oscillospiraceae bacterium]